jgi:NAD(P)-dependent dehydrogenase (short-subunit alcohol dehydrogenase family)
MSADLTGKTILITGGNTGIGLHTAIGLAKLKGNIIIACRDDKKGRCSRRNQEEQW